MQGSSSKPADHTRDSSRRLKQTTAVYTYFLYTELATIDEALNEVDTFVQSSLQNQLDAAGVTFLFQYEHTKVTDCEGPPSETEVSWVTSSFALCGEYQTTMTAEIDDSWDEVDFQRTTLQIVQGYFTGWNAETRTTYARFNSPIQVTAQLNLILHNANNPMSIYEYTFLEDILEFKLEPEATEADPSFGIKSVHFMWQQYFEEEISPTGRRQLRQLQLPIPEEEVQLRRYVEAQFLVSAECGGGNCTEANLEAFHNATFPNINDTILTTLRTGETAYFYRVAEITLNPIPVELFPDSGLPITTADPIAEPWADEKNPYWIWLVLIFCVGVVLLSCLYTRFCLTVRDINAANSHEQQEKDLKHSEHRRASRVHQVHNRDGSQFIQPPVEEHRGHENMEEFDVSETVYDEDEGDGGKKSKKKRRKSHKK